VPCRRITHHAQFLEQDENNVATNRLSKWNRTQKRHAATVGLANLAQGKLESARAMFDQSQNAPEKLLAVRQATAASTMLADPVGTSRIMRCAVFGVERLSCITLAP
jgi:hypothetical protein